MISPFLVYSSFKCFSNFFPMQRTDIPFLPVFASMKRLVRYSIGSIALGSLTVSFVESIRFILEACRRKLKVYNSSSDTWYSKAAYQTSRCCLKSIEWTIKSINRNAYIMVISLV